MKAHSVLICTGSLISAGETSLFSAFRKLFHQSRHHDTHWFATRIKAVTAELHLCSKLYWGTLDSKTKNYLRATPNEMRPELTEVVIATLLQHAKVSWEAMPFDHLYSQTDRAKKLLEKTDVVFVSTTFLHDLSELIPLIKALKKPHNKIVVGGSLSKNLEKQITKLHDVDVLAVGYGEFLVPYLAQWIKSDFKTFPENDGIQLRYEDNTIVLKATPPQTKNLDFLPTPEWRLAFNYHQKKYKTIYYESVRGCPYRCLFCNYPFLFNDKTFRTKSAEKIAEDWAYYHHDLEVKTIICLDSLFTMPQKRLIELCELLIEKDLPIQWICYARSDDLIDLEVVKLMRRAGAIQLQIGAESGNQNQLDRMNKRCSVENNILAIENCRKAGITTLVSLIVGYPGETSGTIEDSFQFMKAARPDFYFLAPFSVRVENVPVLSPKIKSKFGLKTIESTRTFAPYWKHDTMNCSEIGKHLQELNKKIISEKISLEGTLFYRNIENYNPQMRQELLNFQKNMFADGRYIRAAFSPLHSYVDRKLRKDIKRREREFV